MSAPQRVTTRNARFQQWEAQLTNRTKRHRLGEFLVQGVRPITLAVEHGWRVRTLLHDGRSQSSAWADNLWDTLDAERFLVAPELLAELGGKEESPELVAVVEMPEDDLDRLSDRAHHGPVVVFDRPANPGNIGTLARSADAFGAAGLVITGHAADPYDPQSVRASTGSLFALTVVRAPGHAPVVEWAQEHGYRIVGTDESGSVGRRLRRPLGSGGAGRGQRDARAQPGLARGVRRGGAHPDGRQRELAQRRHGRVARALHRDEAAHLGLRGRTVVRPGLALAACLSAVSGGRFRPGGPT